MAVRLVARTLRGLEDIAAREIEQRGLGTVEHRRHREVWFTAPRPDPRLLELRTVDDLLLLASVVDEVGHTRADLAAFATLTRHGPLPELVRTRARYGGPAAATGVDVAASFLGRRNYNRYDIEDTVGQQAAATLGIRYHSRRDGTAPPAGSLPLRVTLEGTEAVLALRITDRPLHRRAYKQASTAGTLHPPLAAALVRLAGARPGQRVLDPCCGTGTTLIEAAGLGTGADLLGSDHSWSAITAATANAAATGAPAAGAITWSVADATRIPLRSGCVDRIVSNPPWDRQVEARGALVDGADRLYRELRRVLAPGGRAVLLLPEAEEQVGLAESAGFRVRDVRPVSLFGSHPSIVSLGA